MTYRLKTSMLIFGLIHIIATHLAGAEQCNCTCDHPSSTTSSPTTNPTTHQTTSASDPNIGDRLWAADHERFGSTDLILDVNGEGRLFTYVNETKLQDPSYSLFISLLDNYNREVKRVEPALTDVEEQETELFLQHLVSSEVMQIVEQALIEAGKLGVGEMKDTLEELWFAFYGRTKKLTFADSSGFEHVFVGETQGSKVKGFHSWVQMYELEKSGHLEYIGSEEAEPDLLENEFLWDGKRKPRGSMFVGTSPEFDMAIYTYCMVTRPGRVCEMSIAGNAVRIQTYKVNHISELRVASAFPMI